MYKNISPEDVNDGLLQFLRGTYWKVARLTKEGCIEFRVCCQQLPGDGLNIERILEVMGLFLGLIENHKEMFELLDYYNIVQSDIRSLYIKSMQRGQKFLLDNKIRLVAECMIVIAKKGLEKRNLNEQLFIEKLMCTPLYKIATQKHPVIREFNRSGLQGLINLSRYKY
jgi:hypothetical protein